MIRTRKPMSTFEHVKITVEFEARILCGGNRIELSQTEWAVIPVPRPGFWARLFGAEEPVKARVIETRYLGSEYAGGE